MCKNAKENVVNLLEAVQPTVAGFVSILVSAGEATTAEQTDVTNAFDALLTAAENWETGGGKAVVAIDAVDTFNTVFNALPVPAEAKSLSNVITAGIVAVVAIFESDTATTTTTVTTTADAAELEPADLLNEPADSVTVSAQAHETIQQLVPGFKPSFFHSPQSQYKKEWNKAVEASGDKYNGLKQ